MTLNQSDPKNSYPELMTLNYSDPKCSDSGKNDLNSK